MTLILLYLAYGGANGSGAASAGLGDVGELVDGDVSAFNLYAHLLGQSHEAHVGDGGETRDRTERPHGALL